MLTYPSNVLPKHIAIIMDGNGRWAAHRFMPRIAGHRAGLQAAKKIAKYCLKKQVSVLTLFAFSTENWRRPAPEVTFLMNLFLTTLERETHEFHEQNVRVRFIGDRSRLNPAIVLKMDETEKLTQANSGMVLIIAIDYGGQWDLYQSTKTLLEKAERGEISAKQLTYRDIESHLAFPDLPYPDLLIRTSGEKRISNFMLWQLAYSELYFTDTLWPDFDEQALDQALSDYAQRERRFGYSSEQLSGVT
jgi:undecaprenyl diphosphate synthase